MLAALLVDVRELADAEAFPRFGVELCHEITTSVRPGCRTQTRGVPQLRMAG
jgi:hypothetical protein